MTPDLSNMAFGTVLVIAVLQIWLGLYPKAIFTTTKPVMEQLVQAAVASANPIHSRAESLLSSHSVTSQETIP